VFFLVFCGILCDFVRLTYILYDKVFVFGLFFVLCLGLCWFGGLGWLGRRFLLLVWRLMGRLLFRRECVTCWIFVRVIMCG